MDYHFWTPTAISAIGTFLLYRQVRVMEAAQPVISRVSIVSFRGLRRYWPIATMLLLMFCSWIPYFLDTSVDYFHSWGIVDNPDRITAVVDGHKLLNKRPDEVMIIARAADMTIDSKHDASISRSGTFEILDRNMRIEAVITPEFAARVIRFHGTEFYLLQVPPSFPLESVHSLADAEKFGAKIIGGKAAR